MTIYKDIYLDNNDCYVFELNDYYGDGLGASSWGGTDGSWVLKDNNNIVVSQGQGNFGYSIEENFYISQSIPSNIPKTEKIKLSIKEDE